MKLAVVTHIRPGVRNRWFDKCQASVAQALPLDGAHHIIECGSPLELEQARWEALKLAEYVCFVDDDDYVLNESIEACLAALEARPNIGVAFTDERYISEEGDEVPSRHPDNRVLRYRDIAQSAQTVHHLSLMRTSKVNWAAKALSDKYGAYADWLVKGGTALNAGCVHVPIRGYAWRQRADQMSHTQAWNSKFDGSLHVIRGYLAAQVGGREYIERLD
jgi:hypothetical protein